VEQLTERIASVSLPTVLLLLFCLTVARVALNATRVALFRAFGDLLESLTLAVGLVFLVLRPFVVQSYYIPSGSMHPTLWEGDHILVNKWVYRMHPPHYGDIVVFRAPPDASPDGKEFIKRVMGLPGDRIEVKAGCIRVGKATYTSSEIRTILGENVSVEDLSDPDKLPPLHLTTDAIWLGDRQITPEEFAEAAGKAGQPVCIKPGRVLRNGQTLMECYVAEDPHYLFGETVVPAGSYFMMGDNRNQSMDSHVWGSLSSDRVIGRADLVFWPLSHLKRIE
jgi:signal peptidase I